MDEQTITATINEHSPRAAEWIAILGGRTLPLISAHTHRAHMMGAPNTPIYELDVTRLTPEQKHHLASHLATQFNLAPEHIEELLDYFGCPVRAEDVTLDPA